MKNNAKILEWDGNCECGYTGSLVEEIQDNVCPICGLTYSKELNQSERKMFTPAEITAKKQHHPVNLLSRGTRTQVGKKNEFKDYNYKKIKPEKKSEIIRISQIQNSTLNNLERNLYNANDIMRYFKAENTPDVNEAAERIYYELTVNQFSRGRSIINTIVVSYYLAKRVQGEPLFVDFYLENMPFLEDIVIKEGSKITEIAKSKKNTINRLIRLAVGPEFQVLNKLNYELPLPVIPWMQIQDKLGLTTPEINYIIKVYRVCDSIINTSKDPKSIIASITYYTLYKNRMPSLEENEEELENLTQKKVSEALLVTEVTIRNTKELLEKHKEICELIPSLNKISH